jgi:hypothetical protein
MRVPALDADAGGEEVLLDPFDAGVELDPRTAGGF